jgi:Flp pilus assembly protein TadD
MDAAVRSVALDDADSASHWVLAVANFWPPLGDKDVAVREAGRALALNPADVDANFTCGTSLLNAGRGAEAVPHLETALRISPRDPRRAMFLVNLAYAYFLAHRTADAERAAREILETGMRQGLPEQLRIHMNTVLVSALGHLGRVSDARSLIDRIGAVEIASGATTMQSRLFFAATTDADRAFLFEGLRKAGLPE